MGRGRRIVYDSKAERVSWSMRERRDEEKYGCLDLRACQHLGRRVTAASLMGHSVFHASILSFA
jgi:hypothetical protein